MKHNFMTKMVSALLAVVLSTAAFSVTAFASGGEETTEPVAEQETAGDVSDLLSALTGSQVTISVTEDGIQFSSGENDSGQTGTVTTGGGNLNVRTGAGMDYTAFTQLPNGTTVKGFIPCHFMRQAASVLPLEGHKETQSTCKSKHFQEKLEGKRVKSLSTFHRANSIKSFLKKSTFPLLEGLT